MIYHRFQILIFLQFLLLLPLVGLSQEVDSSYYLIETTDGNIYRGQMVEKAVDFIKIRTQNIGDIKIRFEDVELIQRIKSLNEPFETGTAGRKRSQRTLEPPMNYAFSPAGHGIEGGRGYYQNSWLFFNHVNLGLSDYFSLGFGILPILGFESVLPIFIFPQVVLPVVKDKLSFGVSYATGMTLQTSEETFGLLRGHFTIGSRYNHFRIGIGNTMESGNWSEELLWSFDGVIRVGSRVSIALESYARKEYGLYILNAGIPLGNVIGDFGLFIFNDGDQIYGFPNIGITVPFTIKLK